MINGRSSGLVDNLDDFHFHILGCGAIGSSTAMQLARMGATKFCLYDMDTVEDVNIGVSQYIISDIDKPKVEALDIAILGFDSMAARLQAVEALCSNPSIKPKHLIDGRMGAEHYQQYIFDKPTVSKYKKTWYSDNEGSPEPCAAKATAYCAFMSGSFIANAVRKLATGQPYNKEFSFNFPNMLLEKSAMVV